MSDAEGISAQISKSLSLQEKQEQEYQNVIDSALLKDHIISLNLGLPCLQRFLGVSNNEDLKRLVRNVMIHPIMTEEYYVILSEPFGWKENLRTIDEFLLKISEVVSRSLADHIAHLVEEIEDLKKKLLILKLVLTYASYTGVETTKGNRKRLTPFVACLDIVACLFYSVLVVEMAEEMTLALKHKLSDLMKKIDVKEIFVMIFRPPEYHLSTESYLIRSEFDAFNILIRLLNSPNNNWICKDLLHRLEFVKDLLEGLSDEQWAERFSYLVATTEDITLKSIPILCSCYDEYMGDDSAEEINGKLSEVRGLTKNIQAEVEEIKLYNHNYPKFDGLGFLDLFVGHLKELLEHQPPTQIPKSQIEQLHSEFDSITKKIKEQHDGHEKLGYVWTGIIGLAHKAEYLIDLCLVEHDPDPRIMLSLPKITQQIKIYSLEVTRIYDEETDNHVQAHNDTETFISDSSRTIDTITTPHQLMGFEDDLGTIHSYVFKGDEQLDVISIVGMGGAGKSTLAMEVFKHSKDRKHFDIQAWCTVSQVYRRRELLLTILRDIFEKEPRRIEKLENEILDDEELLDMLRKSLLRRRYLVVMDDMWDIEVWKELSRFLPDSQNGSRIIITGREQIMNSEPQAGWKVHRLCPLSDDDSWKLFLTRLPQIESYSQGFLQFGKQISRRCMGLPLSIVLAAGLVANVKNIDERHQIESSLISTILNDAQSQCKAILQLSYNNLPNHLKSCFLYFGAFPEDEEIPVQKLKWLWITEGFVRSTKGDCLEDVAEEYITNLINRSLVTPTAERSLGGAKACRVHDLLHQLSLEKAEEERFLQVEHKGDGFGRYNVRDLRRLSIHHNLSGPSYPWPLGYGVRTLMYAAGTCDFPIDPEIAKLYESFIFDGFKLLQVLDFHRVNLGRFFGGIERMIHLRFLAIKIEAKSIPSSIANLWNLQVLLVDANSLHYSGKVIGVPRSLWKIEKLRNVHINHRASFKVGRRQGSLETLSTPCFHHKDEAERLLARLPKLWKLKCVFLECWGYPDMREFLKQLVSLKMLFKGSLLGKGYVCESTFPSSLQKLSLSNFGLAWDDISKFVGTLPNLQSLKLTGDDCDKTWNVEDGAFPELKYLNLKGLVWLREWTAEEGCFPKLEQLVLQECTQLQNIPLWFGGISNLRMIKVSECRASVDDSAREIRQIHKDEWGSSQLRVIVFPRLY